MDFGKVEDLRGIDFGLPHDQGTALPGKPAPDFGAYVGPPVWHVKEWLGHLYPPGTQPKDYLRHYARHFNTIELNLTHYRIPTADDVARWCDQTPPDFAFCPKFPQAISHERQLVGTQSLTDDFVRAVLRLESRLGLTFLQLPPSFAPAQADTLLAYLDQLPAELPVSVEFRHPDWFVDTPARTDFLDELRTRGVGTVLTDVAGRRDVLQLPLTTPVAAIRFVGNGLHPTDFERFSAWVPRLRDWQQRGLRQLFFWIHQPDNVAAPELCAYAVAAFNGHLRTQLAPVRFRRAATLFDAQ